MLYPIELRDHGVVHGEIPRKSQERAAHGSGKSGKEKGGVNFGPPLPLWVHCVWVESLQDALDFAIRP